MVNCERCHRKFGSYAALKQHYINQHSNVNWPAELENELVREQESAGYRARAHPNRGSHLRLTIAVILILIVIGAAWYYISVSPSAPNITGDPTLQVCIGSTPLAEHIHPHLQIIVIGAPVTIPANIGITSDCMRPIHTHDTSDTIHVESPVVYPFTLHDFFLVWGQPFDNTQIMQYSVDSTHTLTMTVNSIPNTQYQNYVMRDGDQIVIIYGS